MKVNFLITRVSLILLFLIVTMLQLFSLPGQFAHMRKMNGISLLQEIVLTGLFTILLLCAQFIIFSLWRLVQLMEQDNLFTPMSTPWLDRIVRAFLIALLMPATLLLIIAPQADDPGILVLLTALTLFLLTCFSISSLVRDQFKAQIYKK